MKFSDKLNKLEAWANAKYKPVKAPWKRPTLFALSLLLLIGVGMATYAQINQQWTNNGVWIVIIPFGLLSLLGLLISLRCKGFWVALLLGGL